MSLAAVFGTIVCVAFLVLVVAVRIPRSRYSDFELKRRQEMGDPQAIFGLKRQASLEVTLGLQQLVAWLLVVAIVAVMIMNNPLALALAYVVALLVLVAIVSKFGFIRRLSQKMYRRIELSIVEFAIRYKPVLRFILPPADAATAPHHIDSREELLHVLREAKGVLSGDETTLLEHGLEFYGRSVGAVMTPIAEVTTIEASELLGPLVLDDLHKTGHTIFPVENNGEIVGMLDISGHAALRSKESVYVRDVMHTDVVRISHSETLDEALKILVAVKQSVVMVIDDDSQTVGLLSLSDVVRALTGWKRR